jgi:hypothetical protein
MRDFAENFCPFKQSLTELSIPDRRSGEAHIRRFSCQGPECRVWIGENERLAEGGLSLETERMRSANVDLRSGWTFSTFIRSRRYTALNTGNSLKCKSF